MARGIHRLTTQQVKRTNKALGDGGNLWINPKGNSRAWLFKYTFDGKSREMGLGSFPEVTMGEARDLAKHYRKILKNEKRDPMKARKEEEVEKNRITPTFTQAAARYILTHRHEWSNRKHIKQWISTMRTYAKPVIGSKLVTEITTEDILEVLSSGWTTKTETMKRVQGRIENILDWARAMKYREGENPARWRGHLNQLLPKPNKVKVVKHHPAMPYDEISTFFPKLQQSKGLSAKALQLLILTATRTSDVLEAEWKEINLDEQSWTIPENRTKTRVEHRVPLTDEVIQILESLPRVDGFVFPGTKRGRPLSNMAMLVQMRRMNYGHYVPHGFRSTFRDWAAEKTSYSRELAEKALAHVIGNEVERAYQRGDMFEKRRKMMELWAIFIIPKNENNIVELRA